MSEHPGLGEPTDIGVTDAERHVQAPPPATNDPDAMDDADLSTGDGTDQQPGGTG